LNTKNQFVEFTCANIDGDSGKVTVTIKRLEEATSSDGVPAPYLYEDSLIVATVKHKRQLFKIIFTPNRKNEDTGFYVTAATLSWPRRLRMPKTGAPVKYEVVAVNYYG